MDVETIVVSAVVGIVASAITAYITTRLKMRDEREQWQREFLAKYADVRSKDRDAAEQLAVQFAVGFLVIDRPNAERNKVFIARGTHITIGRKEGKDIFIPDVRVSRDHAVIISENSSVFIIEQGSKAETYVNGKRIYGREKLSPGDVIGLGDATITFHDI
jgi:pSer/pThr/pTyr-binding forkhead associated (FHA) protein